MSVRQSRGAALIIALALLLMLVMLAVTGMRGAIAEWLMAGNEQFRQAASMAASAGVEAAIASMARNGGAGQLSGESYEASIRYAGDEVSLPGSSIGKLIGRHYEVTSIGTAPRLSSDEQVQGVMVVAVVPDGVTTFRRIGTGIAP